MVCAREPIKSVRTRRPRVLFGAMIQWKAAALCPHPHLSILKPWLVEDGYRSLHTSADMAMEG